MSVPQDLRYSEEHEWARLEDGQVRVGITDYAQHQLGDVVYVELPKPSDSFEAMDAFGVIESVKAASDLFAPLAGSVVEVNSDLEDAPELVNDDPYGAGWMIIIEPDDESELDKLLSPDEYQAMIEEEE